MQVQNYQEADFRAACQKLGYRVVKTIDLPVIDAVLVELVHTPTHARHIHIHNTDRENTFSVTFKTVPTDSTGVAHILEHTVLCGSKKFPVRDPFFSMLKRSLNTFMNAFTASDWTMYPFSTQNEKDFYNLMDVYLDATFFPNLDLLSFKQEGHRLELERTSPDPRLVYKGVVYNEMKGAMSSPDQVMVRSILNAMYPDTTYQHNSGGDPTVIPTLTHEQLTRFHRQHYHPSNAFFYTYGNFSLRKHLAFVHAKVLSHFRSIDPGTAVMSQPRWKASKQARYRYPLDSDAQTPKKAQVCIAWLIADIRDTFHVLALKLLEQILLGNSASPLRKALMDAEMGTALSDGSGFDADNRDTLFACGLKDVAEKDADRIEQLIFDVLGQLVTEGIDPDLIDAAIHQIEFHRREITGTPYPYGIKLLLSFLGSWLHGGQPEQVLMFDKDLERLRREAARDGFFEKQIRRHLLENPHRARLVLAPDANLVKADRERVRAELDALRQKLGKAELDRIEADARALAALQEAPEDTASLPTLSLSDVPPDIRVIAPAPCERSTAAVCYRQPTSGIFYATIAMGTAALDAELLPLIPFFCYALPRLGTQKRDFTEIVQQIDAYTGGINLASNVRTRFDAEGQCVPFITINAKCLNRNLDKMSALVQEILFEISFADRARLKSLLLEYRAGLESMIIHNGHRYAISLSSRHFSSSAYISELWSGIHQLRYIKDISDERQAGHLDSLAAKLADVRGRIVDPGNFCTALVGEPEALEQMIPVVSQRSLAPASPQGSARIPRYNPPNVVFSQEPTREGWGTATAVSFVAKTFQTVRMDHADAPGLAVISKMLRSLYLHREIREKGGAYGGFALYNIENGLFSLASYRDPHIAATLDVYAGAGRYLTRGEYREADVAEAILQVCSDIDRPDPPGQAARKAFYRSLISMTDEARRSFKQRLLELKRKEILTTARRYFGKDQPPCGVAVISSDERLKALNRRNAAEQRFSLYTI